MTMEFSSGAPKKPMAIRPKTLLFVLIGAMYLYVFATNETFLFNKADPECTHIAPFQWWLLPHGLAAAVALFLAPFQLSERLRRKYVMVHKTSGYLYTTACYVGAPLGLYSQWVEEKLGT